MLYKPNYEEHYKQTIKYHNSKKKLIIYKILLLITGARTIITFTSSKHDIIYPLLLLIPMAMLSGKIALTQDNIKTYNNRITQYKGTNHVIESFDKSSRYYNFLSYHSYNPDEYLKELQTIRKLLNDTNQITLSIELPKQHQHIIKQMNSHILHFIYLPSIFTVTNTGRFINSVKQLKVLFIQLNESPSDSDTFVKLINHIDEIKEHMNSDKKVSVRNTFYTLNNPLSGIHHNYLDYIENLANNIDKVNPPIKSANQLNSIEQIFKDVDLSPSNNPIKQPKSESILTPNDLVMFNEVKGELSKNIQLIESAMNQSPRISSILKDNHRIDTIYSFYHSLDQNPEKLIEAGRFVHANLPYLTNIIHTHSEIEQSKIKSERTQKLLDESEKVIKDLADKIVYEYFHYQDTDLNHLENQIKLTKAYLKRYSTQTIKGGEYE